MEHIHWIDEEVIPGAYYGETTWIWPPDYPHQITWKELTEMGTAAPGMFPHVHDFPELLSWWGTNPDDFGDTDPMAMQMDDEIIPLESGWVAYIPANMPHMPAAGRRQPGLHAARAALGLGTGRRLHPGEGRGDQEGRG